VREKDSGILQNVRPSAVDVRGQQPELFPFDAFLYTTGRQGEKRTLTLKEGWEFIVKGRIETSEGVIAGWQITTNYLKSPTDAIRLDSQARRVEVRDSGGSPMIALGYLEGIGSYQSTDYGLYVAPTVKFEVGSGGSFKGGDYVVTDNAAFSIKSGAQEVVRLGALGSGYYGIVIGTSGNQLRFSTKDGSLTVSGTITASSGNIGGWSITSQGLSGTNASLLSAGELVLGSSNEIVKLSSQDSTYRLWIGSTDPALAPFRVTKEGNVWAVAGVVGGWILSTTMLKSADSGARIELNQDKKRISVFDAYNETVAMGYLEGLPKRDGSGYWGAGDYGFWAKQGDRLRIDGDVEYIKGDWLIQNDASYLIKDSQDRVILRMGTDTGEKGFYLYDPTTSTLQVRLGTKGTEKGLYVLENNTGLNYRAKLDTTGFFVGDDNNYVQYDRASSSLTMKVTSFLVSSMGTEIKGSVQISDEGTLGGGLVNPLKLYTSGSGSAKLGIIEQLNYLRVKIGSAERFSTSSSGVEIKGSIQLSDEGTLGGGLTNPLKLYTSGSGSAKVGVIYQAKEVDLGVGSQTLIRVAYDSTAGSYDALVSGIGGFGLTGGDYLFSSYLGAYPLRPFSWDGSSLHFYWTKVGTLGNNEVFLLLEVYLTSDINYPRSARYYVYISSYYSDVGNIVVEEVYNTSYGISLDVCVDTSRNIWIRQTGSWFSFAFYKIIQDYNVSLTKNSNTWQEATPNGVTAGAGEAKRFTISNKTVINAYDVVKRTGIITLGVYDNAWYRLRVNGSIRVEGYTRSRTFWALFITNSNHTYAWRIYEDATYTTLYDAVGKTGAYFIAALNAILSDMGKPTTNVILPATGGIRGMAVAYIHRYSNGDVALFGKYPISEVYDYYVTPSDGTTWDGKLVFWT